MKIVVAMSGGVDSSVAAGLLVEQGHEVIGVHMKLHDSAPGGTTKTCCGLDDALDARRVADTLGIPFYVMNLKEAFQKAVVDDMVQAYLQGRTPSPCIQCNGVLKFRVLMSRAIALGASHLATGHYARVGPGPTLLAGLDPAKDQSYFLFPIRPRALERTLFPLGELTKSEIRHHAARMDLVTAEKPESQELCFIPDNDHARFIREAHPDLDASGEIVDESGRVLGYHDGYYRFTIGQRRGLGVALGQPAYVTRIDPSTRRVHVSTDPDRQRHQGLEAVGCNWLASPSPDRVFTARHRHRGAKIPCRLHFDADEPERVRVTFLESSTSVAPGQAVVVYDDDRIVGGGWITRALEAVQ